MRTFTPKADEVTRQWHVIDAEDIILGRLATHAATLLRGKHKPTFAPHVDTGDFVIVINADKVALSGAKAEQKLDHRHSGYPGGLKSTSYGELLEKNPRRVIEKAVAGMLPHNKLGVARLLAGDDLHQALLGATQGGGRGCRSVRCAPRPRPSPRRRGRPRRARRNRLPPRLNQHPPPRPSWPAAGTAISGPRGACRTAALCAHA